MKLLQIPIDNINDRLKELRARRNALLEEAEQLARSVNDYIGDWLRVDKLRIKPLARDIEACHEKLVEIREKVDIVDAHINSLMHIVEKYSPK